MDIESSLNNCVLNSYVGMYTLHSTQDCLSFLVFPISIQLSIIEIIEPGTVGTRNTRTTTHPTTVWLHQTGEG